MTMGDRIKRAGVDAGPIIDKGVIDRASPPASEQVDAVADLAATVPKGAPEPDSAPPA